MKIAIHHRSNSFSAAWADACIAAGVEHVPVDAYRSDLVAHLRAIGADGFMWPWHQTNLADQLFARQLTLALDAGGIPMFPDVPTAWHFDDKLGQKYLLEAIGVPFVQTDAFYDADAARTWLDTATFPLVHKLRGGAGSQSVQLVRDRGHADAIVRRAFGRGFPAVDPYAIAREAVWTFRRDRTLKSTLRVPYAYARALAGVRPSKARLRPPERGYVYFQRFVPGNDYDDRFVVIGERCFCVRRRVREGDFRASGSGRTSYDPEQFPRVSVALAFDVAERLRSQSLALDVVYEEGRPLCVELSYAFPIGPFLERAGGYFDRDHAWHATDRPPPEFMVDDFVASLRHRP